MKKLLSLTAVAAALLAPQWAAAESDVNTAAGTNTTATARLDFRIIIPRVLFLQVGTGTAFAANTNVDMITFTVPAANLGDGTDVAGTGGNLTGGAVDVRVFGNNGNITLTAASGGGLDINNGAAGDTIPWTELLVTPNPGAGGAGFTPAAIAHPTINSATGTTITATNKVVRQHGTWTFAYDNSTAYAAGTYGGVNTNNGRITYTATLP